MFNQGVHEELFTTLETIGAAFAIYERRADMGNYVLISGNSLYEEITGVTIHECVGKSVRDLFARYVERPFRECLGRSWKEQTAQEIELVIERNGAVRWWRVVTSPVFPHGTPSNRIINTCIEITEKKLLDEQLNITRQRFEAVVETAYDGIISVDGKQNIKLINDAACSIFDVERVEIMGSNLSRLIPQRYRAKHADYIQSFHKSTVNSRPMHERVAVMGLRNDGVEFPVEVAISKIKVGSEIEMTAVVRDISERVRLIDELSKAATHDLLTGIANRRLGSKILLKEIYRCKRFNHQMGIVMLDIDNFKQFNDEYGHPLGDKVIKWVVDIISSSIRETDAFCRWGGEEFLVILPETSELESFNWANRACELVATSNFFEKLSRTITASFGVIITDGGEQNIDLLIDQVDKALYRAKEKGKNCVSL